MRSLVRWSLTFRLVVIAIAAGLVVLAATQLARMPVDALPEFDAPYVEVQTEALGLSAAEVEQFITVPLENDLLTGVAWVDTVRSESIAGLSSVTLIFEPGTDLLRARQVVQERLTQAHALPNVSKPPQMIQPLSSASRVMIVSLATRELSAIEMSVLARWTIRPRLMGVAGVANVAIWGQRERQLQVQVDPRRLNDAGVTLDQVVRTTGNALWVSPLSYLNASTPGSGGFIDTPNQRIGIRHVLPIRTPEDLAQVPIEGSDRRLGEVTQVVEDHQPLIGDALADEGATLLLVIEKLPGANTLQVTRDVESALDAMRAGLEGITVDTGTYRPAGFLEAAIDNTTLAALAALLLVALALVVALRSLRAAFVALVSVLLSLGAAVMVLFVTGATVNGLMVAGVVLALAVVIDDAVLGAHDLARRPRPEAGTRASGRIEALAEFVTRRRMPLAYATAIVALTMIPLLVIDGEAGTLMRPLAIAYLVAVAASMLVAVMVTPILADALLPGRNGEVRGRSSALGQRYSRSLRAAIAHPWRPLAALGLVAVAGLAAIPALAPSLTPQFREHSLVVDLTTTPGMSRPEILRLVDRAAAELRSTPGVRDVDAHVGRAIMSDSAAGMDAGQLWVDIDPTADYDATVAAVRGIVAAYPGLRMQVQSYLAQQAHAVLARDEEPLAVRLFGPDLAVLRDQAERVRDIVAGVPGVTAAAVRQDAAEPQIEVEVDIAAATEHGLKPGDVRRQAATLLSGLEVGNLFEDQKVFEVVVWGIPEVRHSVSQILDLQLDTPDGGQVTLGTIADVRVTSTPSVIHREGISRRVDVTVEASGDPAAVARDIRAAVAGMPFPREYHPEVIGVPDNRMLLWPLAAAVAALLGILLVLQAALGSWRLAALSLLVLPATLAGVAVAALLTGGVATLGTILGSLAVLAFAARIMLSLLMRLQELAAESDLRDGAVLVGAPERLVPTLATALATIAALVPLIVLGDRPGLEVLAPMAIAIVGGLVTTVPLVLFVAPVLYARFGGHPDPALLPQLTHQPEPQAGPQPAGVS